MSLNLSSVLEHSARLVPDRVAITCGTQQITYAELNTRATRVAAGLASIGISPGDRVVLSCPNVPWFPIAYFGILKAGAIVVPINVLLKPREIAYHLRGQRSARDAGVRRDAGASDGRNGARGMRRGTMRPVGRDAARSRSAAFDPSDVGSRADGARRRAPSFPLPARSWTRPSSCTPPARPASPRARS